MTDIKNKPLSVIDASLDRDVAYPPTDTSIFNPYTGGIIRQKSIDSLASAFSIATGKTSSNRTVLSKDRVQFIFGIPSLIIKMLKPNTLYYKFRIFLSLSEDDFAVGKETYFDVNLFTDVTGTNTSTTAGFVSQTEADATSAITLLFNQYTVDEIIQRIEPIKNVTYANVNEKRAAIYANLIFLQVYAQISPITISPNVAGVSAEYHNIYREPTISACNFTIIDSALSFTSDPILTASQIKFSLKIKNIKSLKLKISFGDSTGNQASYLDAVTRTFALDVITDYVTLTTTDDGYFTASINYPLNNLRYAELDGGILFNDTKLVNAFNSQFDGIEINSFADNLNKLRNIIVEFVSVDTMGGIVLTDLLPYLNNKVKYVLSLNTLNAVTAVNKPSIVPQRNSNFTYVSISSPTTKGAAALKFVINSSTNKDNFIGFLIVTKNTIGTLNYARLFLTSEMTATNPTANQITYSVNFPLNTAVVYQNNALIYGISSMYSLSSELSVLLPKLDLSKLILRSSNLSYTSNTTTLKFTSFAANLAFEGDAFIKVTYKPSGNIIRNPVTLGFSILPNRTFFVSNINSQPTLVVYLEKDATISFTTQTNSYSSSFITTNNLGSITW
jgi:hypothetical protein